MKRPRAAEDESAREGLRGVRYFVLDEADRMLDMGFVPQVREIVALMGPKPPGRQSLMFSATWPPAVHALAKEFLREPYVRISIDQGDEGGLCANGSVTQVVEIHRESRKEARLLELLRAEDSEGKTLIFANTKKGCAVLAERLRREGFNCGEIHGNLPQAERASNLADFTRGATRYLVATDVAARGLDVEDITLVVCYDFPDSMTGGLDDYVHRIGRTGRAGRRGRAVTFFPAPEDVSGTRSAGNAYELIKVLEAAGQRVSAELRALDTGPPVSRAAKNSGRGGGKGAAKGGRGSPPEPAEGRPAKRQKSEGGVSVEGVPEGDGCEPIARFEDAPFCREIKQELASLGFEKPTPIQGYSWPLLLGGRDCISIAKTGSGKTLAFLLPAIHFIRKWTKKSNGSSSGLGPLALVVAPTRELATQIHGESERFANAAGCRTACAYGGAAWEPQAAALEAGVELLVATPGRLAFLMGRGGEAAAALARTIAACGAQRQLAAAVAAFEKFCAEVGSPTRQIFSTLMNAHVLCGDLAGAAGVAARMKERGFRLGVVEHTTLLKGELEAGDLDGAQRVVGEMLAESPPLLPDLRLVNTFLRGCVKLGEVAAAADFYDRLQEWGVTPDATSCKMLMLAYRQGLRLKDMLRFLKELEGSGAAQTSNALQGLDNAVGLRLYTAEVACLLGQRKAGKRALQKAEEALSSGAASKEQFDVLRRKEMASEVERLRGSLGEEEAFDFAGALQRTFAFPSKRAGGASAPEDILVALRRSFGLEECFRRELCSEQDFESRLARCFRKNGLMRWPRIFPTEGLPTRLEVCSGTGDWVVAQAQAEAGAANWVASELRYDRVKSILAKAALGRVENLCILAGDAGSILRASVPPASLSHVCVNFPQPPQTARNASCDEAESQLHLLTPEFFEAVHRALAGGGVLTIFSDNQEYTRSLARTVGSLAGESGRLFAPFADVPNEHIEVAEDACGLLVCPGCPGPECGHAVRAESQFDRFFSHGKHRDRWYVAALRA